MQKSYLVYSGITGYLAYVSIKSIVESAMQRRPVVEEVGDLRSLRESLGLSQLQLSLLLGYQSSVVSAWERGTRQPDIGARIVLSILRRDPEYLLRHLYPDGK